MTDSPPDSEFPFRELIGIEITDAGDGYAAGCLELEEHHSANPNRLIAHGAVTVALADSVAVTAIQTYTEGAKPTIDIRMDYLAPATGDLLAEATVLRHGRTTAMVSVDVYLDDEANTHVATGHGTYKSSGDNAESPWSEGRDRLVGQ